MFWRNEWTSGAIRNSFGEINAVTVENKISSFWHTATNSFRISLVIVRLCDIEEAPHVDQYVLIRSFRLKKQSSYINGWGSPKQKEEIQCKLFQEVSLIKKKCHTSWFWFLETFIKLYLYSNFAYLLRRFKSFFEKRIYYVGEKAQKQDLKCFCLCCSNMIEMIYIFLSKSILKWNHFEVRTIALYKCLLQKLKNYGGEPFLHLIAFLWGQKVFNVPVFFPDCIFSWSVWNARRMNSKFALTVRVVHLNYITVPPVCIQRRWWCVALIFFCEQFIFLFYITPLIIHFYSSFCVSSTISMALWRFGIRNQENLEMNLSLFKKNSSRKSGTHIYSITSLLGS